MVTSKLFSIVSYIQSINLLWAFLCLTDLSTFISCIILRSFMNIKPYVHRRKFLKAPRGSWKKGNCNLIFLGMRKIKVLRDVSLLAASDGSKKKGLFHENDGCPSVLTSKHEHLLAVAVVFFISCRWQAYFYDGRKRAIRFNLRGLFSVVPFH